MSKNTIIASLTIVISILIGVVLFTNYEWFSNEWSIGLSLIVGSTLIGGIIAYFKLQNIG